MTKDSCAPVRHPRRSRRGSIRKDLKMDVPITDVRHDNICRHPRRSAAGIHLEGLVHDASESRWILTFVGMTEWTSEG